MAPEPGKEERPMRPSRVKALWREGKPAVACWVSTGDPYVVETLAHCGFDALVLDMQHGCALTPERAVRCIQAMAGTDTDPFVRIPWNRPEWAQFVLDAGAYGVIIPLVNSYEEAVEAVGAVRYPPVGYRSVGPNRALLSAGGDYVERANEEVACLVMVETPQALENLERIARVPGLDGFYIGPRDLATTLGLDPKPPFTHPRHREACLRVLETARRHGLVAGIHAQNAQDARERFQEGFLFSPVAVDIALVRQGALSALQAVADLRGTSARREGPSAGY